MEQALILIASALVIVLVLPVHEFAHAFAAVKAGDPTPKIEGRYTINPLKHFDLLGLIMLLVAHFGWAKPVPVNPYNFRNLRRDYLFVSVAGILANLIMAFLFALLYVVFCNVTATEVTNMGYVLSCPIEICNYYGVFAFLFQNGEMSLVPFILLSLLYFVLQIGILININLFAFNLIPVFPLDGFRILDCLLKRKGKVFHFLRTKGYFVLLGLLIWGAICEYFQDTLPFMYYLDILGFALNTINTFFFNVFTGFWGLFF